jgi:phosphohistidine swiveling domain-containing protein
MNVSRATERITDGQMVTIDGDAGKVILEVEDIALPISEAAVATS